MPDGLVFQGEVHEANVDVPMRCVGRIISRGKGVAGLFIPFQSGLPVGIYSVTRILGEYVVRFEGESAMPLSRLTGLDLAGVYAEVGRAGLTKAEWAVACAVGRNKTIGPEGLEF